MNKKDAFETLDNELFSPLTEQEAEYYIAGSSGADGGGDFTPSGPDGHVDGHIDFSEELSA